MTSYTVMTDDFQEIDGVGPALEEKFNDSGYTEYADLAEADHEELAEELGYLTEDSALEVVVQAQNLADLEEASVEEAEPETEESEEPEPEESEEPETEESEEPETEEPYDVVLSIEGETSYDSLYHTMVEQRITLHRTNRAGVDTYDEMLAQLRDVSMGEEVKFELTAEQLNDFHNAVLEQRIDYKGDNLIDYMDALSAMEKQINKARDEYLF